jgi:hypothetical protein
MTAIAALGRCPLAGPLASSKTVRNAPTGGGNRRVRQTTVFPSPFLCPSPSLRPPAALCPAPHALLVPPAPGPGGAPGGRS